MVEAAAGGDVVDGRTVAIAGEILELLIRRTANDSRGLDDVGLGGRGLAIVADDVRRLARCCCRRRSSSRR